MNISKEFKVGLLFVVAATTLYLGFNFLKGINFFSPTNNYYIVYNDIAGLTESNQVMINGMSVGRVSNITLEQQKNNRLVVEIAVHNDIILGNQTTALLADDGLLGGKVIELLIQGEGKPLESGDTLISAVKPGLASLFEEKAEHVIHNLDSTMYNINKLLVEYQGTSKDIKTLLGSVTQTSNSANTLIVSNQKNLAGMMRNFKELSASLVETEKELKPLMGKFNSFADSLQSMPLKQAAKNANKLLANLEQTTQALNKAEGTLGLMIHDDSLYRNLNKMLMSIDTLAVEFNDDPHRFLAPLGKKKKKRKKNK